MPADQPAFQPPAGRRRGGIGRGAARRRPCWCRAARPAAACPHDVRRPRRRTAHVACRRPPTAEAEADLGAFDGLDAKVSDAELRLAAALGRRRAEADAAAHAESASGWRDRLGAELVDLERAKKSRYEHGRLVQYSRRIESYLVPSVERIERRVPVSLQAGLDEAYSGWLATLVDDGTQTSRTDDTFMPIVD